MESGPEVEGLDLRSAPLVDLSSDQLRLCYDHLLTHSFPAAELMTLEELEAARREPATGGVVVFEADEPVATMIVEEYLDGRVWLLAYLAVAPRMRSRGLGTSLLEGWLRTCGASPVLAEIEDPRLFERTSQSDPWSRLRFYERVGARLLPLDYMQPSLREGSPRVEGLLLIVMNSRADTLDGALLHDFLEEYYVTCEGQTVRGDQRYRQLLDAARGGRMGTVSLAEITDLAIARTSLRTG